MTRSDVLTLHRALSEIFNREGAEHMPAFGTLEKGALDALLAAPAQSLYGTAVYPSLPEKAAIIFYTVNKRHLFANGNKRMSVACLLYFLHANGYRLAISPEEMTAATLELANSDPLDFSAVKRHLTRWISDRLLPLNDDDPPLGRLN